MGYDEYCAKQKVIGYTIVLPIFRALHWPRIVQFKTLINQLSPPVRLQMEAVVLLLVD